MATSSPGITEEENNDIRVFNLLTRVAPPIVRKKTPTEFHPDRLKAELGTNRLKIILPLSKRGVINKKQWALLYPVKGKLLLSLINVTIIVKWTRNCISH
jgi:hypothetical protein